MALVQARQTITVMPYEILSESDYSKSSHGEVEVVSNFKLSFDTAIQFGAVRFEISQVSNWTQEQSWRQYNLANEFIRVGRGCRAVVPCRTDVIWSCSRLKGLNGHESVSKTIESTRDVRKESIRFAFDLI